GERRGDQALGESERQPTGKRLVELGRDELALLVEGGDLFGGGERLERPFRVELGPQVLVVAGIGFAEASRDVPALFLPVLKRSASQLGAQSIGIGAAAERLVEEFTGVGDRLPQLLVPA